MSEKIERDDAARTGAEVQALDLEAEACDKARRRARAVERGAGGERKQMVNCPKCGFTFSTRAGKTT